MTTMLLLHFRTMTTMLLSGLQKTFLSVAEVVNRSRIIRASAQLPAPRLDAGLRPQGWEHDDNTCVQVLGVVLELAKIWEQGQGESLLLEALLILQPLIDVLCDDNVGICVHNGAHGMLNL